MPKIRITETDNTGTIQLSENQSIVYIPVLSNKPAEQGEDKVHVGPVLFASASALEAAKGDYVCDDGDARGHTHSCYNFAVAKRLASLGMPVLIEGFASVDELLVEGKDSLSGLSDKTLYDVRFLTLGAFADFSNADVALETLWEDASKRGDCIALLDAPSNKHEVSDIREFINGLTPPGSGSNPDTFAASFAPWLTVDLGGGDDSAHVPGSIGYLLAFAHSIQSNPVWYAAAGTFRGTIPELVSVDVDFTNADVEMLQARSATGEVDLDGEGDNVGKAINPIAKVNPYGYVVWGNRTLRDNKSGETLPATAFLNVRVLVTEISKTVYRAARRFTFEQNNNVLWTNFKSLVTPLLDRMKTGNGINGYRIAKIADEHRGRLKARITIVPIEAVEDFDIEIVMENSIAEVTE